MKNYKYFFRGQYEDNIQANDTVPEKGKKKNLQEYDRYLKKFQYKNALDSVLKKNNVEMTMSVFEELIDRNALKLALLNRSEEELEIILNLIQWKIRDPKTQNVLVHVFNLLVDYYMVAYGANDKIDELFRKINDSIKEEIDYEQGLLEINETIESINNIYNYYV